MRTPWTSTPQPQVSIERTDAERLYQACNENLPDRIVLGLKVGNELNEPFVVERKLLKEGHMHLRGRTRSGKTSLAIAPLLKQLIVQYEKPWKDEDGVQHAEQLRDSIFVFDLGGIRPHVSLPFT